MVIGYLQLSDVSVICRVVNPSRTSQEIWEVSYTECTGQGNDFKLISTVKWKLEITSRAILVVNFGDLL